MLDSHSHNVVRLDPLVTSEIWMIVLCVWCIIWFNSTILTSITGFLRYTNYDRVVCSLFYAKYILQLFHLRQIRYSVMLASCTASLLLSSSSWRRHEWSEQYFKKLSIRHLPSSNIVEIFPHLWHHYSLCCISAWSQTCGGEVSVTAKISMGTPFPVVPIGNVPCLPALQ